MNIVLIGFMGSGKSTVAKCLSRHLCLPWLEMDDLVYQKTKTRNMHEVFAKGGEPLLRETEIAIAKEIAKEERTIISTGGGVVLNPIILESFKTAGGKVIFLHARFESIVKRLEGDTSRPLFHLSSAKTGYDFRWPLYVKSADQMVDTDGRSPEEIALTIKEIISDGI